MAQYTRQQLEEMAGSVGFWWHSIDLGQGVVTPGQKTPAILGRELKSLRIPELKGKSVLDIGAYDGFYSFEAERRGAERVVALDHYVWSLDLPEHIRYVWDCRDRGVAPAPYMETPHWQPETLPGKRGFDTAHRCLSSRVEVVVDDYMTMDVARLGRFDVVFYLGVLYHMEEPLAALRRLAEVTRGMAIIETHAVLVPGYEDFEMLEFYSSNQLNADVSNWWGPSQKALEGLCLAAGFSRVDVVSGYGDVHQADSSLRESAGAAARRLVRGVKRWTPVGRRPVNFRAVVHAWK